MTHQWRLELEIETQSAFHTFGPGQTLPLVDRALQVDAEGYPYIQGSTVRGRIRVHLERLLKGLGQPVCRPPRPEGTCPHYKPIAGKLAAQGEEYCLACRIFGSAWRSSTLTFSDFHVDRAGLAPEACVGERTSVGISRRLGSAQAERLFHSQTTIPGNQFRFLGHAQGWLTQEELGWLLAAIRLVTYLGGHKARGLGRVQVQVTSLSRWNGENQTWEPEEPQALLREVVDHATL
jgi:CRISPR/Cas system CSM-associated protein Csm3 (group 7 of RAMP superfamily)